MYTMPMPDTGMMSTVWMPMCGQSWIDAAASFLGMWTVMMAEMMLPSLVPTLWRYRQAASRVGGTSPGPLTASLAGGYFLIWTLLGIAVYPLGAAVTTMTMRLPTLGRVVPIATGLVVLAAGALQLTKWKARRLACCRSGCSRESHGRARDLPVEILSAWRQGLRLGLHCIQCCAGLTAALLVTGIMEWPAMIAVTAAISLERLAPAGERFARAIGVVVMGAGFLMILRAGGLT